MLNNLQQIKLKLLQKRVIQKTAEANDKIGNDIGDEISKASRRSLKNSLETVESERNTKRKIYISRRKTGSYW